MDVKLHTLLLASATTCCAAFPGISYNQWQDFEQCATGSAPTTVCLNASDHIATGSWAVHNAQGALTIQSGAQGTESGASGTRGFQYSGTPSSAPNYIEYCFDPTCSYQTSHANISIGFFYKTVNCTPTFTECAHSIIFSNDASGDLSRISDESDTADGLRVLIISPCDRGPGPGPNSCEVAVASNTKYWISFKYSQGAASTLKVYDTSYNLIGTATYSGNNGSPVTSVLFGTDLGAAASTMTLDVDDILMDWATAADPLLPQPSSGSGSSACDVNSDGKVNVVDVQLVVNMYLGTTTCSANINGAGVCNSTTIQRVDSAALGGSCVTGP